MSDLWRSERQTNYIFLGVLAVMGIWIIALINFGAQQDVRYLQNDKAMQQASQAGQSGHLDETLAILDRLDPGYRDSYQVVYMYAYIYLVEQKYPLAAATFQKAEDIRPGFLKDPMFLLLYGQALLANGQPAEALVYLSHARALSTSDQMSAQIDTLTSQARSLTGSSDKEGLQP